MATESVGDEAVRIVTEFENEGGTKDVSPAGWGIQRDILSIQLMSRVIGQDRPDQENTPLCGPASFMFCLLSDRPDIYARFVIDLWKTGRAMLGSLSIEPNYQLRQNRSVATGVEGNINAVDWISLGGLRGYDGSYSQPKNASAGATHAITLSKWFQAVGAKIIYDNTIMFSRANWNDLLKVSCYVSTAWVVMLLNANVLFGRKTRGGSFVADHWVVATSAITIDSRPAPSLLPSGSNRGCINPRSSVPPNPDLPIALRAYSWGDDNTKLVDAPNTTVGQFLDHYHGAFVFSSIP